MGDTETTATSATSVEKKGGAGQVQRQRAASVPLRMRRMGKGGCVYSNGRLTCQLAFTVVFFSFSVDDDVTSLGEAIREFEERIASLQAKPLVSRFNCLDTATHTHTVNTHFGLYCMSAPCASRALPSTALQL